MNPFVDFQSSEQSRLALAPSFPEYVENVVLPTETVVRVAIPAGARFVVFGFDQDFRAKIGLVNTDVPPVDASTSNGSGQR